MRVRLCWDEIVMFVLTIGPGDTGQVWQYSISLGADEPGSCFSSGLVTAPDLWTAARQVAVIGGQGFAPGTLVRMMFATLADDPDAPGRPAGMAGDGHALRRYRQVAGQLRERIGTGQYEKDSRVPSMASLGREFGVAGKTVRRALGVLVAEGLVDHVPGRRYYIQ